MEQIGYIYKLTAPNGKVYIGQTIHLEKRMQAHSKAGDGGHLQNSIRSYGWDSFQKEVICSGPFSQEGLNQLEIHFIRIYNSFRKGLNMTEGGGGMRGLKQSQETIAKRFTPESNAKRSASLTGRHHTVESNAKRSASLTGGKRSPQHRARTAAARLGKKHKPETIAKLKTSLKGRPAWNKDKKQSPEVTAKRVAATVGKKQSPETIAKRVAPRLKPISQYTKDGVWIRDWPSQKEAMEVTGITSIDACLRGRTKTAGGCVWKYKS